MTSAIALPTPRLSPRVHAALFVAGTWSVVAAINGVQNILRAELYGWPVSISWALTQNLIYLIIWALATPLIIASARRFAIRRPRVLEHGALHLVFGSCFVVLLNFLGISFEALTTSGFRASPVVLATMQSVAHLYHAALMVYLIIVAVGHLSWTRLLPATAGSQETNDERDASSANGDDRGDRPLEQIAVRRHRVTQLLPVAQVDWIEASGDHVILHAGRERHKVRERLTALHQRLDPNRFVRIHRSAVVNVSRVTNVQPYHYGDLTLLLTTGRQLRVSRTRRRALEAALGQRL